MLIDGLLLLLIFSQQDHDYNKHITKYSHTLMTIGGLGMVWFS